MCSLSKERELIRFSIVLACSMILAIIWVADIAVFTPSFLNIDTFLGLDTVATDFFT